MMVLQEERHRRETLERKLQEETQLREELVSQQIKLREKQKQQVILILYYLLHVLEEVFMWTENGSLRSAYASTEGKVSLSIRVS